MARPFLSQCISNGDCKPHRCKLQYYTPHFITLRSRPQANYINCIETMDIQQIIRWIVIAIMLLVAVFILGSILNIAGFLLQFALKALIILFVIAVILRFFSALAERRR